MIALFLILAFIGLGFFGFKLMNDSDQVAATQPEAEAVTGVEASDQKVTPYFTVTGKVLLGDGATVSGTKVTWLKFAGLETDTDPGQPVIRRKSCLLYTSPSPRDRQKSRMPSSA